MSRRLVGHLLLGLAGLVLALFGVVSAVDPHVTCRGVEMGPGDVCQKNDLGEMGTSTVQSYEERRHAARLSQPVVIVLGAGVVAFSAALVAADRRRDARA